MNKSKFTLYNIIGAILWIGGVTMLGYFLGKQFPDIIKYLQYAVIGVVIVSLAAPLVQWMMSKKK